LGQFQYPQSIIAFLYNPVSINFAINFCGSSSGY